MFKGVGILLCITASLLLLTGCGTRKADTPVKEENTDNTGLNLVYKHPDMEKVGTKRDIVYKTVIDKKLKLDVYYPLGVVDSSKAHTVVLVHGIGPIESFKDTDVYQSWGRVIAANGFNAVTFNWRPSVTQDDVSDLIKYIRENSKDLKINPDSMSIFAFSAGVKEGVKEAILINTGFVKNIIAYYGQLDTSVLKEDSNTNLPPMFIAMAALDTTVPPGINDSFIKQAEALGCKITYVTHSKAGHGFDVFNDDRETYDIIEKSIAFIKDNGGIHIK